MDIFYSSSSSIIFIVYLYPCKKNEESRRILELNLPVAQEIKVEELRIILE